MKAKNIIQQFYGYIEDIDYTDKTFTAIVSDMTNKNNPDEFMEIYKEKINLDDIDKIANGNIFYLNIFYYDNKEEFLSEIVFPKYTKKDIARINKSKKKSKKLSKKLSMVFE